MLLESLRNLSTRSKRKRTPEDSGASTIRIEQRAVTATVNPEVSLKELCSVSKQVAEKLGELLIVKPPLTKSSPSYEEFKNEPTNIPLETYIKRVLKLTRSEPQCALMAVVYIERMKNTCPGLEISQTNVRRIVFTAMLIASKVIQDIPYNNKFWAAISGTYAVNKVNKMEIDMLMLMDWKTNVDEKELAR